MARPNNKDSPSAKRQQELRNELQTIRQSQQSSKSSRTQVMDKVKRLDENLKSRMNEQKTARSKVQYKSVDEVQKEIDALQKGVDTGTMRIVDEKKALADISQLNRQKKGFAGFEEAQKGIDDVKNQIAELKKQMDDPESRALSDRYTEITSELDKIKAEQDEVFKSLNSLRDERTKAHDEQQKKYFAVKEIKDQYFKARRAAQEYEREARRIRDEKRKAENDAYHRGRRQEAAKSKLEDASAPAYQEEIRTAQNLLAHFDPSSIAKQQAAGPGKFAATAQRTVDESGIKGTKLKKKGDEEEAAYFIGGGGKKKKGGRGQQSNGAPASPSTPSSEGKFNLDIGTIDSLGKIGVDPPMSQSDIPAVAEKLKEKLEHWKGDQEKKTKEVCLLFYYPHDLQTLTIDIRTSPKPKQRSTDSRLRHKPLIPRTTLLRALLRASPRLRSSRSMGLRLRPARRRSRRSRTCWLMWPTRSRRLSLTMEKVRRRRHD